MVLIAVQGEKQNRIYAYNEKGKFLEEEGQLYNYTSNSVAIRRGEVIYIYDETGKVIKRHPYDFENLSNIVGEII